MPDEDDLVGKLAPDDRAEMEFSMRCIGPDDAKYRKDSKALHDYLTAKAEWLMCAEFQRVLLETRVEFDQARPENLAEVVAALPKLSALNMSLLEGKLRHDQLAVLKEIGRYVSIETAALLHPGTTSYCILDTSRAYLFGQAYEKIIRPQIVKAIAKLNELARKSIDIMQVGRTHLQNTSPVLFGGMLAGYSARLAGRLERLDADFGNLKGKVSGIVGTGASIEMVVGKGRSIEYEHKVLEKLGLDPDYTATQIVQKESLADVGHGLTTIMHVLADFANDIRQMYSSAIGEVTSRENAESLGGSSADATKNNPVNWENIAGKAVVVESGMRILYDLIATDFQRDLRSSVEARYQPQAMMTQTYEAFTRLTKALEQLSINDDKMAANLEPVRAKPGDAMTSILRGAGWVHPEYGTGHEFVKHIGRTAIKEGASLVDVALRDEHFREVWETLGDEKQAILNGELEKYLGSAKDRAEINIQYASRVIGQ